LLIAESSEKFADILSISKMSVRQNEYMLGTKDGIKFVTYNAETKQFGVVEDGPNKTGLGFLQGR
jgi:hypothetical protein